jgi:hypothetical protein
MKSLTYLIHQSINSDIVPLSFFDSILPDKSEDSKKALLKRACKKGELIRIKNGLYLVNPEDRKFQLNYFTLANYIIHPSYVSLESALAYYDLIPEAVYTITSVSTAITQERPTEVAHFSFSHLKINYFNFGFYQKDEEHNKFLIATPLKAFIDYVFIHNKNYQTKEEIEADLRFDWEEFISMKEYVNKIKIQEYKLIYKSQRIKKILSIIEKAL